MAVAKKMYRTIEGRCKDYIQFPKANGYQSLHSTHEVAVSPAAAAPSSEGDRHTHFELQVRTASMHHKAEYGHAAHWSYKAEGKKEENLKWMRTVSASSRKTWKAYRPTATGSPGMGKGRSAVPETVSSGRELVTWLHLELQQRKVCPRVYNIANAGVFVGAVVDFEVLARSALGKERIASCCLF